LAALILMRGIRMLAEGEFTEAEYKKLVKKVDFILLPLVRLLPDER